MKIKILLFVILSLTGINLFAQTTVTDSIKTIKLDEVIITSNRIPVLLKNNPGSVSLVNSATLSLMPKCTGSEEALRLVPGVRIDNQHTGERIHMSIRGQGILTERGLRGIGVLVDGLPVNDPSGFAPDLYDVDWSTVNSLEVLRGPAASLYGGSGSAGLISISTGDGVNTPIGGTISQSLGTNGFKKSYLQIDGTVNNTNYRLSFSRTDGDGYRDHQAFWGNKFYEKINFQPTKKLKITQIISHFDYFHQNPEGLSLEQLSDPKQANPDACPFNEYQKTNRTTLGTVATYQFNNQQDIQAITYYRSWNYKETSNRCAEYRTYTTPGFSVQDNFHWKTGSAKTHLSLGADQKWQQINIYKLESAANPNRKESTDETNLETDSLLANQVIIQSSTSLFGLFKFEAGKFNLMGSIRYDAMNNELSDKMLGLDTAKTTKNFNKTTARIGCSYTLSNALTVFVNWSQGFIPPSTEELASNPVGYSGFNTHLVPATSTCNELGLRGYYKEIFYYELTGFMMNTKDDFFRFKQSGRGNQEVFYGNAGNSKRNGLEAFLSFKILKPLSLQLAYTYADFKYSSATIDPVYTDTSYVLTTPPASGQCLPNSPKHQLYAEVVYTFNQYIKISLGTEYQSKWAIYTDAKAYNEELDPTVYKNWQNGFNLYNARIAYAWKFKGLRGELSVSAKNFTGAKYMAFTEPDPDGNSYQPGPRSEFFGNLKISF